MKRVISIIIVLVFLTQCCYADNKIGFGNLLSGFFDAFRNTQEDASDMTHSQIVAELRDMGIEIPDEAVEVTESLMEWIRTRFKSVEAPYKFAANLLYYVGCGEYDYDTGIWTPTSSSVYAFDAEVYDIEHMYRLFLQGIASIVTGFEPYDIQEDIAENNVLYPTTTVSFMLNGNKYEQKLRYMGDWFNDEAIDWVNKVLRKEGFEYRLHGFYDYGQGLIIVYGDDNLRRRMLKLIPQL